MLNMGLVAGCMCSAINNTAYAEAAREITDVDSASGYAGFV